MFDPVVAEDGNTYERAEIFKWIASKSISPLNPSCPLDASRLMSNRAVKLQVEQLVGSGELDDTLCAAYLERKETSLLEQAQKLYREGKVEEAAELGLPKAQGLMAHRCWHGTHGVAKDLRKSLEWAKKAAAGGDKQGQFRLGYAYCNSEGGLEKDYAMALKWFEKAAEQGGAGSMFNIGALYYNGGHGVTKNLATAVSWFRKAAEAGNADGQSSLGVCYYYGRGVTKNLRRARRWFKKAAARGHAQAMCARGCMMVKGEGGIKNIKGGIDLWERAAADGDAASKVNLDKLSSTTFRMQ
jgi:TPR repeat protein